MQKRPVILLALSIVLGVGAVALMQIASAPATPAATPVAKVVVARTPLRFGDKIDAASLAEVDFPVAAVPAGAFGDIGELVKGEPRVALSTIQPSEVVLASKISASGGKASLSSVVATGMRAMAIRVNDVNGVAGFITPTDRVDVLLTRGDKLETQQTETLLQGVKVLAIDQTVNEHADKPAIAKAVTLEVSPEDAQKLTLGSSIGTLSLALRNIANADAITTRPFSVGDLNPQQPPPAKPVAKPVRRRPQIEVIRGSDTEMYVIGHEGAARAAEHRPDSGPVAAAQRSHAVRPSHVRGARP